MKTSFTFVIMAFLLFSCSESFNGELIEDHPLLGKWVDLQYQESGFTMEKSSKLKTNEYGYDFRANGTLINRSINGWCGTPPIVTKDYEGTWRIQGDNIIVVSKFWGGKSTQTWKVTPTSNKTLLIEIIDTDYEFED